MGGQPPVSDAPATGNDAGGAPSAPVGTDSLPDAAPQVDTGVDWMNLGATDDLDVVEVQTPEAPASAEPVKPVAETAPQAPVPQNPATATPPQPATPAPQPAQEQQPPAPAQAAPAEAPPRTPQSLAEQLNEHRGAIISDMAAKHFALTPEEATELDTNPNTAIPKLMARTYYDAMQASLMNIQKFVPVLVKQLMDSERIHTEAEKAFYGKFKGLDRSKHHDDVLAFAQMLRGTNPQITQENLIAMVGAAVAAKHGIVNPAVAAAAAAGNGAQPIAQPAPFAPAKPGAKVTMAPEGHNPWMGMGQDYDED